MRIRTVQFNKSTGRYKIVDDVTGPLQQFDTVQVKEENGVFLLGEAWLIRDNVVDVKTKPARSTPPPDDFYGIFRIVVE